MEAGAQGPGDAGGAGTRAGESACHREPQGPLPVPRTGPSHTCTQEDIERQVQALHATKLDTESLKDAQERAAALERSLAELNSRLAALDESNNVKGRALATAISRAEAAEAAVMELQEKLEAAERAAMAVRSDTAAADVEELVQTPKDSKTEAAAVLVRRLCVCFLPSTNRVTNRPSPHRRLAPWCWAARCA